MTFPRFLGLYILSVLTLFNPCLLFCHENSEPILLHPKTMKAGKEKISLKKYVAKGQPIHLKKGGLLYRQGLNLLKIRGPAVFSWHGQNSWRFNLVKGRVFLKVLHSTTLVFLDSSFLFFPGLYKVESRRGRRVLIANLFGRVRLPNHSLLRTGKSLEYQARKPIRLRHLTRRESREITRYFSFENGFQNEPEREKSRHTQRMRRIAGDRTRPEFFLTSPWPIISKPFFKLSGLIKEEHLKCATFQLDYHSEKNLAVIGNFFDYSLKVTRPGQHRLVLRAWDKNGNQTKKIVFFEYLKFSMPRFERPFRF